MSRRNNMDRIGASQPDASPPPQTQGNASPLNFVAPTEFVELPSKGNGYDVNHPMYGKDTIEIRYMTA